MSGEGPWARLSARLASLESCTTVDDVARVALTTLLGAPAALRTGVGLSRAGGRRLAFLPSEQLEHEVPRWCDIDGLADVPLVRAVLTGRPVLMRDADELTQRYPRLMELPAWQGTHACATLPLAVDDARLGAVMVAFDAEQRFDGQDVAGMFAAARRVAEALHRLHSWSHLANLVTTAHGGLTQGRILLPVGPKAPRTARHFLHEWATRAWLPEEAAEAAELCLSEVVTNAFIHAGTEIEVAVSLHDDRVHVTVTDRGTEKLVHRRTPPAPDDVGGRGLLLVDALAASWGAEQSGTGTTVWFDVAVVTADARP